MSKLLTVDEVIANLEDNAQCKVWNVAMIGEGVEIENTDHHEIFIYVTRNESDVEWIQEIFVDVLNVVEIKYTGVPVGPARPSTVA